VCQWCVRARVLVTRRATVWSRCHGVTVSRCVCVCECVCARTARSVEEADTVTTVTWSIDHDLPLSLPPSPSLPLSLSLSLSLPLPLPPSLSLSPGPLIMVRGHHDGPLDLLYPDSHRSGLGAHPPDRPGPRPARLRLPAGIPGPTRCISVRLGLCPVL
jgi:hypothetical protein